MKRAKPKFRVGQVVNHNGSYRKVSAIEYYAPIGNYRYFFGGRQYPFFEEDLRPLTVRERGPR